MTPGGYSEDFHMFLMNVYFEKIVIIKFLIIIV